MALGIATEAQYLSKSPFFQRYKIFSGLHNSGQKNHGKNREIPNLKLLGTPTAIIHDRGAVRQTGADFADEQNPGGGENPTMESVVVLEREVLRCEDNWPVSRIVLQLGQRIV